MNNELNQRITRIQEICGAWGLYEPGNSSVAKQQLKAVEEIGEIAKWHLKGNKEEVMDGVGDVFVCWVNVEELAGPSWYNGLVDKGRSVDQVIINMQANIPNIGELDFIAKHYGVTLFQCIDSAIEVISKRTGKLVNGAFVKDVEQEEITDEFTLKRIDAMVKDMGIDLDGDIHQKLADKFVKD